MRCRVRRPWVALFAGALLLGLPAPRAAAQPDADDGPPRAGAVILVGEMPNPDLMALSVAAAAFAAAAGPPRGGAVILAGERPTPALRAWSVAAPASPPDTPFLRATPKARTSVKLFLDSTRPATIPLVGRFPPTVDPLRRW